MKFELLQAVLDNCYCTCTKCAFFLDSAHPTSCKRKNFGNCYI